MQYNKIWSNITTKTVLQRGECMKKSRMVRDMTSGNILGHLIIFTIPMLIGNLFQQVYNIVDSVIVGRFVGENALAAVGATGSLNFLFFSLCNGLAIGIGVLASQYYGANDEEYVKKTVANSRYVVGLCAVIMSVLGVIFARPLLVLLKTPGVILDDSVDYMRIACAGIIAIAAYNTGASLLRAFGDSSTPLYFLLVSCAVNVALDLLFVVKFNLAVKGVAYATVIAQVVAAVGCLGYAFAKNPYFKLEKRHMAMDTSICTRCFGVGLPIAAQSALISISCIAVQVYVNGFGEVAVAAFTAVSRIEQIVHQPFNSLSTALSTFAGQNIGAGNIKRVVRSYWISTVIYVSFSIMMIFVSRSFGEAMISIFVDEPAVIEMGAAALRITSYFYAMLGAIYVTRGLLNGAGDTMNSLVNGAIEVCCRIGFSLLCTYLAIGVFGAWYAQGLTWLVAGAACFVRYLRGRWKSKSLVKSGI